MDFSRYELKKKGTFQISSGGIFVTDPGLWMGNEISALNGRWFGFIVEDKLALIANHEDYLNKQTKYENWLISVDSVDVDRLCGIFDPNPSNSEGITSKTYYGGGSFPYFVYKTRDKKAAIIWVEFTSSFFDLIKIKKDKG